MPLSDGKSEKFNMFEDFFQNIVNIFKEQTEGDKVK